MEDAGLTPAATTAGLACLHFWGVRKYLRRNCRARPSVGALHRRYRLKVRTWPSQGQNPGSTPGIATKNRLLQRAFPSQKVPARRIVRIQTRTECWARCCSACASAGGVVWFPVEALGERISAHEI